MTTIFEAEQALRLGLEGLYEPSEAHAIGRIVLEQVLGLSHSRLLMVDKDTLLSPEQEADLQRLEEKLLSGVPLQYALGLAPFAKYELRVAPGVLIPRPETEELVALILEEWSDRLAPRVLDVGTGSGCIAYALSAGLGPRACVEALEISEEALGVARANFDDLTRLYGRHVQLHRGDVLSLCQGPPSGAPYDLIVSNPPYIHPREAEQMTPQVLGHEPSMALFAPETDPLVFYRALAQMAREGWSALEGEIWAELNPLYAEETLSVMQELLSERSPRGELLRDLSGKQRFVRIILDTQARS